MSFIRLLLSLLVLAASSVAVPRGSAAEEFRTIDGSGNNVQHPEWGRAHTRLRRLAPPAYEDGIALPSGSNRPSARHVSNVLSAQSASIPSNRFLTDMVWQWGQFLTHDTDLTEAQKPPEPLPIPVPQGDPHLDPFAAGTRTIRFFRSIYDPETGTGPGNPREQINEVTSFIDASQVYGSDPVRALALRTMEGGKLKTSEGNLLPFNAEGFPNEIVGGNPAFFLTGDIRANEQIGLTALHTLFVREHNRLAGEIAAKHPELSDEELFERARRIVGAQMQAITYNEFLPALLGRPIVPYRGYEPNLDASVANVYATASFRLHSMVSNQLLRLQNDGTPIPQGHLTLREASLAPQRLVETGIDPILKGLVTQIQQEGDLKAVDGLRNILFGPPGSPGTDVIALDIQRGRDHGLPDYNTLRRTVGLAPHSDVRRITRNKEVRARLRELYPSLQDIDAFVGMFAEDHALPASVGPLVRAMLLEQFRRLRDGDRFWYERTLSGPGLQEIRNTRLSDIIRMNTGITKLQQDVFRNPPSPASSIRVPPFPLLIPVLEEE